MCHLKLSVIFSRKFCVNIIRIYFTTADMQLSLGPLTWFLLCVSMIYLIYCSSFIYIRCPIHCESLLNLLQTGLTIYWKTVFGQKFQITQLFPKLKIPFSTPVLQWDLCWLYLFWNKLKDNLNEPEKVLTLCNTLLMFTQGTVE